MGQLDTLIGAPARHCERKKMSLSLFGRDIRPDR